MKRVALIVFFLIALVATWFASVPQATMLVAKPVYERLAPGIVVPGPDMVWIANVVWTPIAGAPLSTAERHGWPHVFTWILGLWAFLGTPIAGAILAAWALRVSLDPQTSV